MTVQWSGSPDATGNNNRFAYKHLQVMEELPEDHSSILTFAGILFRVRKFKSAMIISQGQAIKKKFYGSSKPQQNTVVVTNPEGLSAMEDWVTKNVTSSGSYEIPVTTGYIAHYDGRHDPDFTLNDQGNGFIRVAIKVVNSGTKFFCVNHLEGATL